MVNIYRDGTYTECMELFAALAAVSHMHVIDPNTFRDPAGVIWSFKPNV